MFFSGDACELEKELLYRCKTEESKTRAIKFFKKLFVNFTNNNSAKVSHYDLKQYPMPEIIYFAKVTEKGNDILLHFGCTYKPKK